MYSRMIVFRRSGVTILRHHVNFCLREMCAPLKPKTVLNVGAHPDDSDKEGRKYEDYFPGANFRTLDLEPDSNARHIQGDLMRPPIGLGHFDLVIANSVLEHVDRPWLAAPHITKMVKPGGHLFICMPWFYPVHEGPHFGDHWRSTVSGMRILFDELVEIEHRYSSSSVKVVHDRRKYWNEANSAAAGFCLLMQRP